MHGCPNFAQHKITELNPPSGPDDKHYVCADHDHWGDETAHYTFLRHTIHPPRDMGDLVDALQVEERGGDY